MITSNFKKELSLFSTTLNVPETPQSKSYFNQCLTIVNMEGISLWGLTISIKFRLAPYTCLKHTLFTALNKRTLNLGITVLGPSFWICLKFIRAIRGAMQNDFYPNIMLTETTRAWFVTSTTHIQGKYQPFEMSKCWGMYTRLEDLIL